MKQPSASYATRLLTASLGSEPVDRVIGLTHRPDLTAKSDSGTLVLDGLSVGVDVGNGDLDRRVVLGGDQPV